MPRPASANDTPIAMRIPADWLSRATSLVASMSPPGITVTRTDVLRAAMAVGLDALEGKSPRTSGKGKAKR